VTAGARAECARSGAVRVDSGAMAVVIVKSSESQLPLRRPGRRREQSSVRLAPTSRRASGPLPAGRTGGATVRPFPSVHGTNHRASSDRSDGADEGSADSGATATGTASCAVGPGWAVSGLAPAP